MVRSGQPASWESTGAWLAGLIGVAVTISLGLIRWIFSVVAAMIFINVYITATRR